jgi:hypothetical protein
MYFIEVPSKDWTFDAAQSHYINKEVNQRAQALRNLKSDLEKIVKSENFTREAVQKAKQYFNNYDVGHQFRENDPNIYSIFFLIVLEKKSSQYCRSRFF